jgi:hypothetical protein
VNLDILPRCRVQLAAGKFIRQVCDFPKLSNGHFPIGDFYPNHLYAGLSLAIDTASQTNGSEFLLIDLEIFELRNLFGQVDDIFFDDRIVEVFKLTPETLHSCSGFE